ncbi:MAG: exodeoxyribonuclease VII large subunit [Proteobacteria bacterium]|nr:exodeoxyribonuclease VII large subunit [Pseudomonadota bacterium]
MIVDSYDSGTRNSALGTREQRVDIPPVSSESRIPGPDSRFPNSDLPHIHTISELTELIKGRLEREFAEVWVTGEVTDFKGRKGPHLYFTLKDERSQIRAIIWGAGGRLPFEIEDGQKLVCRGSLNVYAPKGNYSLIVDPEHCEPEGLGALKLAFEQLKKSLAAEGLFDAARKRPIPYLPRRIGIVTAPAGAAIRDLIHVLTRRHPGVGILLHPARVQGEGAAAEIAAAIENLNRMGGLDVLIVGRGGGSIEDLWCFNEEIVARAIAASKVPVISAVGHEIDYTIADFVADLRAATPSAAAELAVPVRSELLAAVRDLRARLEQGLTRFLERKHLELKRAEGRLADPTRRFPDLIQRIDGLRERLINSLGVKVRWLDQHLAKLASNLDHLSPLGVLAKGYAVVQGPDGLAVRDAAKLKKGDSLGIRFHRGSASAKVTKIN